MRTKRKLLPGDPGTKILLAKYSEKLICVRYRYDTQKRKKLKTVELIEEEYDWQPNKKRISVNKIVRVKIAYRETESGKLMRRMGVRWNRQEKVWETPCLYALNLGIPGRIVEEKMSDIRQRLLHIPP